LALPELELCEAEKLYESQKPCEAERTAAELVRDLEL
jgi:hypothetical protein